MRNKDNGEKEKKLLMEIAATMLLSVAACANIFKRQTQQTAESSQLLYEGHFFFPKL